MTLRLAVLLSGGGTTMENIQAEIAAGRLDAEIACVLSSRDNAGGLERARRHSLPTRVVASKDFRVDAPAPGGPNKEQKSTDWRAMSAAVTDTLAPFAPDLLCFAGYLCRYHLPDRWRLKAFNIHPALLPAFGGRGMWGHHIHEAVRAAGVKLSGCTVHFVDDEYDTGPIVLQRACPVYDTDSADDIAARVFQEECVAYPEAIRLFGAGRLKVEGRIVRVQS